MIIRDLNSLNVLFQRYDDGDKKLSSSEIAKMTQEEVSIWNIKEGQTYEEVAQNNNIQLQQQQQIINKSLNIGHDNNGSATLEGPATQSGGDTKITDNGPVIETHGENSPVTIINIDTVIASKDLLNALSDPAKEALARIFANNPETIEEMGNLETDNNWQKLSLEKQIAVLEAVKYPRSVLSLVADGEFDDIKKNENGTVSLSSSQHCYNLALNTNDEESLKGLSIVYSGGRNDGRKGDQMELSNLDSSYLFITGNTGENTENKHLVIMENCGYNGILKCDHTPDHQVAYVLRSGVHSRNPISSNYIDLTYHSGDTIEHTSSIKNKNRKDNTTITPNHVYSDLYNSDCLEDGKTYKIKENSERVSYDGGKRHYRASEISGLPKPAKREPVKSFGV